MYLICQHCIIKDIYQFAYPIDNFFYLIMKNLMKSVMYKTQLLQSSRNLITKHQVIYEEEILFIDYHSALIHKQKRDNEQTLEVNAGV